LKVPPPPLLPPMPRRFTSSPASLSLHSGPVERVCRRWRQLALQLPASLSVYFCSVDKIGPLQEVSAVAVERLLPHLQCRRITALRITGCTSTLAPEVPGRLARPLYPELRRWVLGGAPPWTCALCQSIASCLFTLCSPLVRLAIESAFLVSLQSVLRWHQPAALHLIPAAVPAPGRAQHFCEAR